VHEENLETGESRGEQLILQHPSRPRYRSAAARLPGRVVWSIKACALPCCTAGAKPVSSWLFRR